MKTMDIAEREKVVYLSEALADPALTFFYDEICPDDSRSGNSMAEAATARFGNMAPNVSTLFGALHALQAHFCTESARNVLKQDLDQLTLGAFEREENVSKPKALTMLKEKIKRLSANGPPEYDSETCMVTALKQCLAGEAWAIDPIINADDRASKNPRDKTIEHYTQTLVSYLRTRDTSMLGLPRSAKPAAATPPMSHGYAGTFYGDARMSPRTTRTA